MADVLFRVAENLRRREFSSAYVRRSSRLMIMAQRLRHQIEVIRAVVFDAEAKQNNSEPLKNWLIELRNVCYDVIDVLDEWSIVEMKFPVDKEVRFFGPPLSFINSFRQCVVLHVDVAQKMRSVTDEIENISRDGISFNLLPTPREETIWVERRATIPFVGREQMYGRSEEAKTLIKKLINEGGQAQVIQYISIVGMAGIGKTALAQDVYNRPEVVKYFTLRVWVCMSEEFNLSRIAKAIVESLASTPTDVDLESLLQIIRQIIVGNRYLLVLDDVWNKDYSKWAQLAAVFNCGAPGSTILITTREVGVARKARSTYIEHLNGLSVQDCWSIIKDRAFDNSVDEHHKEMFFNKVGKDIAEKSGGLPVIAKSLGAILRFKSTIEEWQRVLTSDIWHSADLRSSFMLSYSFLPPVLRQCLLYCSIFPKNHDIDIDKLIKLWMAQDFFASDQDDVEREGWRCFEKLLDHSFFQKFKQDDKGKFKYKLEGAMTEFIQSLAENECHIMLLDDRTELRGNHMRRNTRHCTLNVADQGSLPAPIADTEKLHTLMVLSEFTSTHPTTLTILLSHMRRLRALELSSCSIKELPLKVWGELLHLRCLDLSFNRDLKKLPQAICKMFNLQTLNLNGCDSLRKLPKGIGNLTKLRHLQILWTTSLSYLPKGVANLTSLRTLNRFFGSSGRGSRACNLGDLEKLNYLQGCISIDGLGDETGVSEAKEAGLKNKKHLRGLELWFSVVGSESSDEGVLEALEAPPDLECLGIFYYRGMLFPDWMATLDKLTDLMLSNCSTCKSLPPLGKLPSLESLEIKNMPHVKTVGSEFLGLRLDNEEGSSSTVAFPKLKKLHFQMLNDWEDWVGMVGEGGHVKIMPSLSSLSIVSCAKIKALPIYIRTKETLNRFIKECLVLERNLLEDN